MAKREEKRITVGELKMHLEAFTDDMEVSFCGLEFYRTKRRGDDLVQIEFTEALYRDETGVVQIDNQIDWKDR